MTNSENLDICPFCNNTIPQGPAYFCPTCGKRLDDKYSNRKIIFDNTEELIENNIVEDSSIDEFDDIESLIKSNSSYSNDLISDSDVDEENLSDVVEVSSDLEDEEVEPKPIEEEPIDEEHPVKEITVGNDSRVLSLKSQNHSIKLDLFLEYCVDENFLYNFLRYRVADANGEKHTLINRIMSSFDLKSLINYKYKYTTSEFENILDSFFKPLKVVDIVEIAEKYDVKVSLSKESLKINFMEKFYPYDLILILNNEGFNISDYLRISVLEQIYLLSDEKLMKEISKCPHIGKSRYEMISCIVNYHSEGFLISNNKFERGGDAK